MERDYVGLIPLVGEVRAKILKKKFKNLTEILQSKDGEISSLDGFSPSMEKFIKKSAEIIIKRGIRRGIRELAPSHEYRCTCGAIVSSQEIICHKCGRKIVDGIEDGQRYMNELIATHFKILENPYDADLWEKRAEIFEEMGLEEERSKCEQAADKYYEMYETYIDKFLKELKALDFKREAFQEGISANRPKRYPHQLQ